MKEVEFRPPGSWDCSDAEALIERVVAERGLVVGMKGSLASYPGSIHWHLKKPKQKGTLEITVYLKEGRIWAQVQNGRKADWINEELTYLRRTVETELRRQSSKNAQKDTRNFSENCRRSGRSAG